MDFFHPQLLRALLPCLTTSLSISRRKRSANWSPIVHIYQFLNTVGYICPYHFVVKSSLKVGACPIELHMPLLPPYQAKPSFAVFLYLLREGLAGVAHGAWSQSFVGQESIKWAFVFEWWVMRQFAWFCLTSAVDIFAAAESGIAKIVTACALIL